MGRIDDPIPLAAYGVTTTFISIFFISILLGI